MEEIKGDLHELFYEETTGMSGWRASWFYWVQVINFLRPFAINGQNSKYSIMFYNNLKIAHRNLVKHKTSAFLNILSLSIGIGCFTFIFVYLNSELKYDRFHQDADLIYRVPVDFVDSKNNRLPDATTPPALGPALVRDFPEVQTAARLFPGWGNHFLLSTEDGKQFFEADLIRTDSTFFDVFSFPLLHGNRETALDAPDQIVLTRKMAIKYFGKEDAVGEKIILKGEESETLQVSAVLMDLPAESHFHFDFLTRLSFDGLEQTWGWYNFYTYVKMHPQTDMSSFESKLQPFFEGYQSADQEYFNIIYTQPLTSIHLNSHLKWELSANGDIKSVWIFAVLAAFVLLVSCLNYVNLTTAQSVRRFKEVGIRKVFGANKAALVGQFIIETLLTAFISLLLAFLLCEVALGQFAGLLGRAISLGNIEGLMLMAAISGIVLILGILAGLFPAFYLSTYNVASAVKGFKSSTGQAIKKLRSAFLVAQFSISALMILGALVVFEQLNHLLQSDKGFEPNQVLIIENGREVQNYQTLKNELLSIPEVQSVSNASGVIGKLNWTTRVGHPDPFVMNYLAIDADFIETMGLKTTAGRAFSKTISTDKEGWNFMVNETGFRELGISVSDLGQSIPITQDGDSVIYGTVIGVLKDFQFTDLKMKTKPFAFFYRDVPLDYISIKLDGRDVRRTLTNIEETWSDVSGGLPIDYFFLDRVFDDLVSGEKRLSHLMLGLTLFSFFIAFMGMFAIANMTIKDRQKEIAIRKVLGSSVHSVVTLVTSKFLWLVLLANVLSIPLAYIFANKWLEGFSSRTNLGPGFIVVAMFSTFLLVLLVVGGQSLKAALGNPVNSLRQD